MLALVALLAAAAPVPHGEWVAYDFREQRVLPLKVDRVGVFGLGFELDGRPVTLRVRARDGAVVLKGAVDAGDVSLPWLSAGDDGAWLWMEGRPWRVRRLAAANALEKLAVFPLSDEVPELLTGEPWVLRTATGLELLTRARARGKYARRAALQRTGDAFIALVDEVPVAVLARDRPKWLAGSAETAARARCLEAQWKAKTALKAAYAAMRALRPELGRYPAKLREAGWGPRGDLPYRLRVIRADQTRFLIEAEGHVSPALGDRWTIDEAGALLNPSNGCG